MFAEKIMERADEIASLWGTKGVYQRHARNIERDIDELMKNLSFNNEDTKRTDCLEKFIVELEKFKLKKLKNLIMVC